MFPRVLVPRLLRPRVVSSGVGNCMVSLIRHLSSEANTRPLAAARVRNARDISRLAESVQTEHFRQFLQANVNNVDLGDNMEEKMKDAGLSRADLRLLYTAACLTYLVHVESRVSSACGQGFYTIGPCGEELVGAFAMHLKPTDAVALHYRHVSTQIARQLRSGRSIEDILLDRARGHTVSTLDPVTGGVHCAIGGGPYDFLVTSTLASQACPAVGRAMGSGLATFVRSMNTKMNPLFPKDMVSFVSLGDGSANNAHMLSALNTAEYAQHRKFKCPVVFCITDNDVSISLRGYDYIQKSYLQKLQMPIYKADGKDILDLSKATKEAVHHARTKGTPVMLYVSNITRRFGHAATDRQNAYLSGEEITKWENTNPLTDLSNLVARAGVLSFAEQASLFAELHTMTITAFDQASGEPKVSSREALMERVSMPLVQVPAHYTPPQAQDIVDTELISSNNQNNRISSKEANTHIQAAICEELHTPVVIAAAAADTTVVRDVMRKHMTKVFDDMMAAYPQAVYIGEDVMHGGYYLVTDGLAAKYPHRVRDFPPDETSLLGIGVGFAQNGLLPIVEIPYAKYLDCGFDMFTELAISSWLSNRKQPNGMFLRLQGVGKGVFGGNYHTHNTIYTPPGIDVVCYSNGRDYAMGTRYGMLQASRGRVVMSVDFTHLLNLRHIEGTDEALRLPMTHSNEYMDFDTVRVYDKKTDGKKLVLISYGEGMVTSLQTQNKLNAEGYNVVVIDCPLLSDVPQGLYDYMGKNTDIQGVVFVEPCKENQSVLAAHAMKLHNRDLLSMPWKLIAAQNTYNPLGNTVTFVSVDDVVAQVQKMKM